MGYTGRYPDVGLSEALVVIAGGLRATRKLSHAEPDGPEVDFGEVLPQGNDKRASMARNEPTEPSSARTSGN